MTAPSESTTALYERYVLKTYGRFPLVIERGEGCRVWDEEGRSYLDFGGGIAVCSLGHAHPVVTKAISEQAARLVHTSNLYYTRPQAELARRLVELTGAPGRVFFCNSGAEANEGLIKLARKFGSVTGGRHEVLTFERSFHGRTLAGISATAQQKVKIGFEPLVPGFRHLPVGGPDAVRGAVTDKTAAILIEPVQGEGGIHVVSADFLKALRAICDEHGLLLLFDEVQCGLGRTGDWCAWKSIAGDSVMPDGVSWAKGIANGFPLGAFWVRERTVADGIALHEVLGPGSHGTTYGGNPVACAAGLAVLDTIAKANLLQNALEAGAYLREEVRALDTPAITGVRAIGLMIGIELAPAAASAETNTPPAISVTLALQEAGLLVVPAGENVIRLLPPLNVTRQAMDEALEILRSAFPVG